MVHVIIDTTAGLPRDLTRKLGIPVIPQYVIFGEKTYRDDSELDTLTFLKLPKGIKTASKNSRTSPRTL